MNQKELKRLYIIYKLLDKKAKADRSSRVLDLSTRQIRRISKRVRENAEKNILPKLRGKPSSISMSPVKAKR